MTRFPLLSAARETHIPVYVLSPEDIKNTPSDIQKAAQITGFTGKPGLCKRYGRDDNLMILAGLPESQSCFQWSAISEKLSDLFGAEALTTISFGLHFSQADQRLNLQGAIGWGLGGFRHVTYKSNPETFEPAALLVEDQAIREQAIAILNGCALTRDLIHIPANSLSPEDLADAAEDLGKLFKAKVKITRDKDLLKDGYPMVYAVGDSSHRRPCLADIRWGPKDAPKLTLVGKGITFDTGGLNIKPAEAMKRMKKDMGGAAHVLGLASMIMEMGLPVNLRVLIPAAENAISSHAFRQQDVFTARNGKTIEIGHTDAEGRLVLSDALAAASEDDPDLIIDFATLTGAARVALGYDIPALFSNQPDLAKTIQAKAFQQDDPVWELPLWQGYRHEMDSHIADINSIGTGRAGAIYGALFLQEFIGDDADWVHLDVYGWSNDSRPGRVRGGCDYGLRACIAFLQDWIRTKA